MHKAKFPHHQAIPPVLVLARLMREHYRRELPVLPYVVHVPVEAVHLEQQEAYHREHREGKHYIEELKHRS